MGVEIELPQEAEGDAGGISTDQGQASVDFPELMSQLNPEGSLDFELG